MRRTRTAQSANFPTFDLVLHRILFNSPDASFPKLPRIYHRHASRHKWSSIPCCHRESMYGGNGSDLTICHRDCPSGCAGFADTRRVHGRRLEVEWKNAIAKESHEQVAERDSESLLALSI